MDKRIITEEDLNELVSRENVLEIDHLSQCGFNNSINMKTQHCSELQAIMRLKEGLSTDQNIRDLLTHCSNESVKQLSLHMAKLKFAIEDTEINVRHDIFKKYSESQMNLRQYRELISNCLDASRMRLAGQSQYSGRTANDFISANLYQTVINTMGIRLSPLFAQNVLALLHEVKNLGKSSSSADFNAGPPSAASSPMKGMRQFNQELQATNGNNNTKSNATNITASNGNNGSNENNSTFASIFKDAIGKVNKENGNQNSTVSAPSTSNKDLLPNITAISNQIQKLPVAKWKQEMMNCPERKAHILLNNPWGVTYCQADGYLYIGDRCNNQIVVLNSDDCTLVETIGRAGSGPLEFQRPSSICYDSRLDRLIVVDKDNHRVQILERKGYRFLFEFGERGNGGGAFNYPWDCAVDSNSNIYISNTKSSEVDIFTSNGRLIYRLTGYNGKKLASPRGLHYCKRSNQLFVTDFEMHKLVSFKIYSQPDRIIVKGVQFYNSLYLKRPQAVTMYGDTIAIANSRSYEVKLYNLSTDELWNLPQENSEGLACAGVCFGESGKLIYATDVEKSYLIKFTL